MLNETFLWFSNTVSFSALQIAHVCIAYIHEKTNCCCLHRPFQDFKALLPSVETFWINLNQFLICLTSISNQFKSVINQFESVLNQFESIWISFESMQSVWISFESIWISFESMQSVWISFESIWKVWILCLTGFKQFQNLFK